MSKLGTAVLTAFVCVRVHSVAPEPLRKEPTMARALRTVATLVAILIGAHLAAHLAGWVLFGAQAHAPMPAAAPGTVASDGAWHAGRHDRLRLAHASTADDASSLNAYLPLALRSEYIGAPPMLVETPIRGYLASVATVSTDDAWAVGGASTVLRWDGAEWTVVDSGTETALTSVAMVGADDGWAVGDHGTILR